LSCACRPVPATVALIGDPRTAPLVAGGVAFVVFLAVWTRQALPPNGDEPHYLVIAQSLLLDHDVAVQNNYARGDYLPLTTAGSFVRTLHDRHQRRTDSCMRRVSPSSRRRSPSEAIGRSSCGLRGVPPSAPPRLESRIHPDPESRAAWFGWAVVALTVPVVLHGTLVYPDPMRAWSSPQVRSRSSCRAGTSEMRRQTGTNGRALVRLGIAGLGAAIGMLPWLHTRLACPGQSSSSF
jgi:hypothetical protein